MLVYLIVVIPISPRLEKKNHDCSICGGKGFIPITKINLSDDILESRSHDTADSEKKVLQDEMDEMKDTQKKYFKKEWVLRILGTIIIVSFAAFGLLFGDTISQWVSHNTELFP